MAKKATTAANRNSPTEPELNLQTYFSILNGIQEAGRKRTT